jgi:DegV family protein with EDD domain
MKIVTDNASDIPVEMTARFGIIKIPLGLTFNGMDFPDTTKIIPDEFYQMLRDHPDKFPTTSQPAVGRFIEVYENLVKEGQEILSVHISSRLSGTYNTAKAAAEIVKQKYADARIHLWDTKTLSVAEGWQVLTACSMEKAGKSLEEIEAVLGELRKNTRFFFTLDTLKYLIHGGRISHLKGLIASMLNIRPIIMVDDEGKYVEAGKFISFKRALGGMASVLQNFFEPSRPIRIQLVHGENLAGVAILKNNLAEHFQSQFSPIIQGDVAAGAHVGPSIVGVAVGYADQVPDFS